MVVDESSAKNKIFSDESALRISPAKSIMFSQAVLDHFTNPRNAGELPNADTTVEVSNPVCGDILKISDSP